MLQEAYHAPHHPGAGAPRRVPALAGGVERRAQEVLPARLAKKRDPLRLPPPPREGNPTPADQRQIGAGDPHPGPSGPLGQRSLRGMSKGRGVGGLPPPPR